MNTNLPLKITTELLLPIKKIAMEWNVQSRTQD